MSEHYDQLETRAPEERERALLQRLPACLAHAAAKSTTWAARLAGVDPQAVRDRQALAALPVLRKADLLALQQANPPFGGCATAGWGFDCPRVFQSPGPLHEPEGPRRDYWRTARALHAAGLRSGMLVHNSFSYHFTPAGSMLESGAHALGCSVFPAGVGQTELQLQAIASLRPAAYVGTPSFLRILLEKAAETGSDCASLQRAVVSGEAFPPSARAWLAERGIDAFQIYASADLGLIAYETPAREGWVLDEEVLVEIVRPGTDEALPEGEVGEVVVTSFNPDYPLIRYGTGDLSALLPGPSPCGRTNVRLRGWMGRADQAAKVRGMFVHPGQIADAMRRHPEVLHARLVVDNPEGRDCMVLHCEADERADGLAAALAASLRDITKLRAEVRLVTPDSLPRDGKVIEDRRRYE